MSGLKDLVRKWMGGGTAKGQKHHHKSGAEGRAFQVNSDPEPVEKVGDDHEPGAEGHAFQVNGDPEQDTNKAPDNHED